MIYLTQMGTGSGQTKQVKESSLGRSRQDMAIQESITFTRKAQELGEVIKESILRTVGEVGEIGLRDLVEIVNKEYGDKGVVAYFVLNLLGDGRGLRMTNDRLIVLG